MNDRGGQRINKNQNSLLVGPRSHLLAKTKTNERTQNIPQPISAVSCHRVIETRITTDFYLVKKYTRSFVLHLHMHECPHLFQSNCWQFVPSQLQKKVSAALSAQPKPSPERAFLKKTKQKKCEWQQFAITDNNLMRQKESGGLQVGEMSHTVGGSVSITERVNSSICIQLHPSTLLLEYTTQTELV